MILSQLALRGLFKETYYLFFISDLVQKAYGMQAAILRPVEIEE